MSSSDTGPARPGTILTHVSDSKSFRLIELPLELQGLLEGEGQPVLYLESGAPHAVLVSPTHRYIMTQRNTSNSLVILEPASAAEKGAEGRSGRPAEGTGDDSAGLNIIGTIHETIELRAKPERGPKSLGGMKHTGSMGKWDEKFGSGR